MRYLIVLVLAALPSAVAHADTANAGVDCDTALREYAAAQQARIEIQGRTPAVPYGVMPEDDPRFAELIAAEQRERALAPRATRCRDEQAARARGEQTSQCGQVCEDAAVAGNAMQDASNKAERAAHHGDYGRRVDPALAERAQSLRTKCLECRAEADRAAQAARKAEQARKQRELQVQLAAREAAEAERERIAAEHSRDPKWMRPVLSATLCRQVARRAEAKAELARSLKYSREAGGAVTLEDAEHLRFWRDYLRSADEREANAKQRLRSLRLTPLPCREPTVAHLSRCLGERDKVMGPSESDQACRTTPLSEYLDLAE